MLKDLHTRVSNAIDLGYVEDMKGNRVDLYGENGLNVLGNLVQGNADNVNQRFFGGLDTVARKVFGFGFESNVKWHDVPSALEMFSTSMRDPVFYSVYKNVLSYYMRFVFFHLFYSNCIVAIPRFSICFAKHVFVFLFWPSNLRESRNLTRSVRDHYTCIEVLAKLLTSPNIRRVGNQLGKTFGAI